MLNETIGSRTTRDTTWPLVAFTALAVLGAGLIASPLAAIAAGRSAFASSTPWPGAALLAGAMAVSLAHLGRAARAPRALARVGRSPLSTEIALAVATLAAAGASLLFPARAPLAWIASSIALLLLVSIGLVYDLPGQRTWRGPVVLSPLTMGLAVATCALVPGWEGDASRLVVLTAVLLPADLVVALSRLSGLRQAGASEPCHPAWFRRGPGLVAARCALVDIIPIALAVAGLPRAAFGVLALGVVVDRLSFYLLAARQTTESALAAVEDHLESIFAAEPSSITKPS